MNNEDFQIGDIIEWVFIDRLHNNLETVLDTGVVTKLSKTKQKGSDYPIIWAKWDDGKEKYISTQFIRLKK